MKLHHLLESTVTFDTITYKDFDKLEELSASGKVVNTQRFVNLSGLNLKKLPCQFGIIGSSFQCKGNVLSSLEGLPSEANMIDFSSNNIKSLVGIHRIIKRCYSLVMSFNPIKEGGIGLILIEGLKNTSFISSAKESRDIEAFEIIEKYLGQGKIGLLKCQEELVEAGLEEFAKL